MRRILTSAQRMELSRWRRKRGIHRRTISVTVAVPADPILILPGLALMNSMNSGTVLAGTEGLTSMTSGPLAMLATGAISRMKSKLS